MAIPPQKFDPDYAVHPGATLKECIEHYSVLGEVPKSFEAKLQAFCVVIEEDVETIEEIIWELAPITEELAHKFSKVFHMPATFWLNYQDSYDAKIYELSWKRRRKKPLIQEVCFDDLDETYPEYLKRVVTKEGAHMGTYDGQVFTLHNGSSISVSLMRGIIKAIDDAELLS